MYKTKIFPIDNILVLVNERNEGLFVMSNPSFLIGLHMKGSILLSLPISAFLSFELYFSQSEIRTCYFDRQPLFYPIFPCKYLYFSRFLGA